MDDRVFHPEGCEVPYVAPIEDIPHIGDCVVPPAPEPIRDCVDKPLALPAPRGAPGAQGPIGSHGSPGPAGPPGDVRAFFESLTLIGLSFSYPVLTAGGNNAMVVVLIDHDIEGATEYGSAVLDDPDVIYRDENGSDLDQLTLLAYERVLVDLKYYRPAQVDDPGVLDETTGLVLATVQTEEDGDIVISYDTIPIYYDDGQPFIVGSYTRADYPDYPENELFPPDGEGTYAEMPEDYFNRKWRGIAVNRTLVTATCKPVSPPPLIPA
jgi:hypothetical protein